TIHLPLCLFCSLFCVLSYCRSLLLPYLAPDRSSVSTLLSVALRRGPLPYLDSFSFRCLHFTPSVLCGILHHLLLPLPDMWYDLISLVEEKRRGRGRSIIYGQLQEFMYVALL
uniref:Uncharacterized protein n=1 Tax=Aegilops tauschii subsp. strangulata TaxID=200361 RepID=A0A452YI63_AEGTS